MGKTKSNCFKKFLKNIHRKVFAQKFELPNIHTKINRKCVPTATSQNKQ